MTREQKAMKDAQNAARSHLETVAVELEDAIRDMNFADVDSVDMSAALAAVQDQIEALEDRSGDYTDG